jgi:hypothetical protein
MCPGICCEIGMALMATKFVCGSHHYILKKCSPQLGGLHRRYELMAAQRDVGGRIFGERQDIVPGARPREIPRFYGAYGVRVSAAGLPETVLDPNLAKDGPSTCKFRLDRQPTATRSP